MARADRMQTPLAFTTTALAKEGQIYTGSGGVLLSVSAINSSAGLRYLQLFDAAATPGAAAVPIASYPVAAGGLVTQTFAVGLALFPTTGIRWSCSTTPSVHTIAGSAELLVWGEYYPSR